MKDGFVIVSDEESLIQKRQRKQEELGKPGVPQWKRLRLNGEIEALNIQIEQVDMPTHVFKEDRAEEKPDEVTKVPLITIDDEAIRFQYIDGHGRNLFFDDLFSGVRVEHWQAEIMLAIKKAYDECISINQKGE